MKLLVLLSAYNGETYLRQQLDSLPAQTLPGPDALALRALIWLRRL